MADPAATAGDPDLDAEFELFQRQLQAAVASAAPHAPHPPEHTTPHREQLAQSPSASAHAARPAEPARAPAQPAGRWKWDGSTWRWRADLTSTLKAASPAPSSCPAAAAIPKAEDTSAGPASASASASASTSASASASAFASTSSTPQQSAQPSRHVSAVVKRTAAGKVWHDRTLAEFPENDHRLFVGDLAPDATEAELKTRFPPTPHLTCRESFATREQAPVRGTAF
ncbi:hypothetical protein FGB62_4g322 [Gracilaria domingensis]|nr:hypothetical protein FGB62_4g322 [Gracilaria domingensis]